MNKLPSEERESCRFYPPIGNEEINQYLSNYKFNLPANFTQFYLFSHGAILEEFKILNLTEIYNFIREIRETYFPDYINTIIPFAYIMDTGDFFAFDMEKRNEVGYRILDCFHEVGPADWNEICYGFTPWLREFIKNNMSYYWLKT